MADVEYEGAPDQLAERMAELDESLAEQKAEVEKFRCSAPPSKRSGFVVSTASSPPAAMQAKLSLRIS